MKLLTKLKLWHFPQLYIVKKKIHYYSSPISQISIGSALSSNAGTLFHLMHDDDDNKFISLLASAFMGCKFPALCENADTGLFMCVVVGVLCDDKNFISPIASAFMGCKFLALCKNAEPTNAGLFICLVAVVFPPQGI